MHRSLIVVEKANRNYSAYSLALPGCVATGETREETEGNMYQAMEMHLHGLVEDNQPIPSHMRVRSMWLQGNLSSSSITMTQCRVWTKS